MDGKSLLINDLIAAQQYLMERSGLQSSLRLELVIELPDMAEIYYSERRGHYVLTSNYNGRYGTARAAIDDWLFYLSRKISTEAK